METNQQGLVRVNLSRAKKFFGGIDKGERLLPAGGEALSALGWLLFLAALGLLGLRLLGKPEGVAIQYQKHFGTLYSVIAFLHAFFLGLIGIVAVRRAKDLVADRSERYPASRVVEVILSVFAEAAWLYFMYTAVTFILLGMIGGNEALSKATIEHFDLIGALPIFGSVGHPTGFAAFLTGFFFASVGGLARIILYYLSECATVLTDIARNTTPPVEPARTSAPRSRARKRPDSEKG